MSSTSPLSIAISLLLIFGSRASVFDKDWPSKRETTPRPTKWTPPSYEKEREWMKNWDQQSVSRPTHSSKYRSSKWSKTRPSIKEKELYPSRGCGYNANAVPGSTREKFLAHDGLDRSYIVHLPPTYNHGSDEGHPIILSLHGGTETAQIRMEYSFMNEHADANNYIAVYPQATSLGEVQHPFTGYPMNLTTWNTLSFTAGPSPDGPTCAWPAPSAFLDVVPSECRDIHQCNFINCEADDLGFIEALLDELEATHCIDRSRIYVTGHSNGGFMTQRLGCELNHRLAAISPGEGQLPLGYNCEPKYHDPMPILNIWGTNDNTMPGEAILSETLGFYITPVSHVQYKYGKHNKCNVDEQLPEPIATASDGILEWQCVGYNGCDRGDGAYGIDVMSCSWNGTHTYPVDLENEEPFGLNVIWDFFKNHTQIPRERYE